MEKSVIENQYEKWIDGLKGIACIIVMLGHSVACIFPTVYFGLSYQSHSLVEEIIYTTPIRLVFNASMMVVVFFMISGYLFEKGNKKFSFVEFVVYKYISYLPMIIIGVGLPAFVMKARAVNSIRLAPYSHAANYVQNYNDFTPSILGKNSLIKEIFLNVYFKDSIYNNVLWYISVLFIGEIFLKLISDNAKEKRKMIFAGLVFIMWIVGGKYWKLQYLAAMFIGSIIGCTNMKIGKKCALCSIISGMTLLVIESLLHRHVYIPNSTVPLWCMGVWFIFIGIKNLDEAKKVLENKLLCKIGKISFGIYIVQWPVIISISCGVCLWIYKKYNSYMPAGIIGIISGSIIVISLAHVIHKYVYRRWIKEIVHNKVMPIITSR